MVQSVKSIKTAEEILSPIYPVIARQIIEKTGLKRGICLDIGRSDGSLGKALSVLSDFYVLLMDNSYEALCMTENVLHEINNNDRRIKKLYGDICKIPLDSESVHLAVSWESVLLFEDKESALEEIHRVLIKGGYAYLGVGFGNKNLGENISVRLRELNRKNWEDWYNYISTEYNKDNIEQLLSRMNLKHEIIDDETGLWMVISKPK
jgi:ubiquinone/menaquinone biosynthesis C-methylase UbiE